MANRQKAAKKATVFTQGVLKTIVLIVTCLLIYGSLVLPDLIQNSNIPTGVGEVASQEILAPYSVTYESKVYTERARKEAAAAVEPVYLPADPSITRHQLEELNTILYYISSVRNDAFATREQKLDDLASLSAIILTESTSEEILTLSDQAWQNIGNEASRVLEQVLRETIRNDNVGQVRSNLPAMIDFSFPSEQSQIIIALTSQLIVPTSLLSEEQTSLAREQSRTAIEPISRQIIAGEVLVRRGQIIREEDYEALNVFGLAKPTNQNTQYITSAILVLIIGILTALYYKKRRDQPFTTLRASIVTASTFVIFLAIGRFLVVDRTIIPYLYPIATFGLTISIIFNLELGVILSLFLSFLTVFGSGREAELALFYLLPSLVGMLTIGKARRIGSFLGSGVIIGLVGMGVVAIYRLGDTYTDLLGLTSLLAAALINGLASGTLALLLHYLYSQSLDIPTALQLLDISRPDHPLLQYILQNAPGSYQHSLVVSNLGEQAAEAIGADQLLVRVGALFHDCGKSNNPDFFIENQNKDKIDSHDSLDPVSAAATIIHHVDDGVALAKKYRLPSRVIDFIKEHHGTMVTWYQYSQALAEANRPEDVDKSLFTYPGPKPSSRETAILMLADGTEARFRAESPRTEQEVRELIRKAIDYYKNEGQLDNTDLTLRDLTLIGDSFFETLQRSFHPRIHYPELKGNKTEPVNVNLSSEPQLTTKKE